MNLIRTDRFKSDFKRLPKHLQRRTEKALRLFAENIRHPSLRAKKMEGQLDTEGREIWEARVTKAYRFTFVIDRDTCILRRVGPHEEALRNHPANGHLGEFVTDAMRKVADLNPDLKGVLDIKDFNERQSGQRTLDDDRLAELIEVISCHRLGLKNTEPDILGRAYEYLLRKFAEGQGQSAGEYYTPKEVGAVVLFR